MSWQIWLYIVAYPINSILISFELESSSNKYWVVPIELLFGLSKSIIIISAFYQEIQLYWLLISLICFVIVWDIMDVFKIGPFKLIENNKYPWPEKALFFIIDMVFKFPALIAISVVVHALNT